jgi:hypothetical protein
MPTLPADAEVLGDGKSSGGMYQAGRDAGSSRVSVVKAMSSMTTGTASLPLAGPSLRSRRSAPAVVRFR